LNPFLQSLIRVVSPAPVFPEAPNGVHEAFRLRRKEHGHGRGSFWRRVRRGAGTWHQVRAYLLPWAVGIMAMITMNNWNLYTLTGLLFVAVMFLLLRSQGGKVDNVMPASVTALLMNARTHQTAMVDVWMTGAGGRELAHAVYREGRLTDRSSSIGALAVLYVGGAFAYLVFRDFAIWRAGLFLLSALALICAVTYATGTGHGYRALKEIERKWKREMEGAAYVARSVFLGILIVALAIIGMFVIGIFVAIFMALWDVLPSSIRELDWEYLVSAVLLVVSGSIALVSPAMRRWNEERIRNTVLVIEDIYNYYMRMMIVADPEYR